MIFVICIFTKFFEFLKLNMFYLFLILKFMFILYMYIFNKDKF